MSLDFLVVSRFRCIYTYIYIYIKKGSKGPCRAEQRSSNTSKRFPEVPLEAPRGLAAPMPPSTSDSRSPASGCLLDGEDYDNKSLMKTTATTITATTTTTTAAGSRKQLRRLCVKP